MHIKNKNFLIGSAVFIVSFLLSFFLSEGFAKLAVMYEAKKIAVENEKYLAEKEQKQQKEQIKEEPLKVEEIAEKEESQELAKVASQIEENIQSEEDSLTELTLAYLVARFRGVENLSENEEWQSYPVDIRKKAFALMNGESVSEKTEEAIEVLEITKPTEEVIEAVNEKTTEVAEESGQVVVEELVDSASTAEEPVGEKTDLDDIFSKIELGEDRESEAEPQTEVVQDPESNSDDIYIQEYEEYTVKSGDSWIGIASRYGITYDEILAINEGVGELIIGNIIFVPKQK